MVRRQYTFNTFLFAVSVMTGWSFQLAAAPEPMPESPEQQEIKLTELPNPLTLEALFNKFSQYAPSLKLQTYSIAVAQSSRDYNQTANQFEVNLQGRLAQREFGEQRQDHNMLALHIGKVLYDSERSHSQLEADTLLIEKEKLVLSLVENQQKLEIAKAYMNVILADFQYRIDNEAMAIEYVGFDKVKDKHAIGQFSDVDLLAAEKSYQLSLLKRSRAEQAQLQTRIELANTMGLPHARPDEAKLPKLNAFSQRTLKHIDLETLQKQVIQHNLQIKALMMDIESQKALVEKARHSSSPTLRADAWVGQLSSQPEIREGHWKAQISMNVPLYDGGLESSGVAKAIAKMSELKAQRLQLEQTLRSQVAEIYFDLQLLGTEKKYNQAFGDYADLYLDYSRALYENESKTDFGDSLVRLSEANFMNISWEFKQALLWMQLDHLLGSPISLENTANSLFVEVKK